MKYISDQETSSREIAKTIIARYSDSERDLLLKWAQEILAIRNMSISKHEKMRRIFLITKEIGIIKPSLAHVIDELKRVAWTERSKPMRGVIGGAGVGLLASVASPVAGVAAFGGAIAVPVVLLGAGAGAVLMAIVDELGK